VGGPEGTSVGFTLLPPASALLPTNIHATSTSPKIVSAAARLFSPVATKYQRTEPVNEVRTVPWISTKLRAKPRNYITIQ
jgi:hypothetical protein